MKIVSTWTIKVEDERAMLTAINGIMYEGTILLGDAEIPISYVRIRPAKEAGYVNIESIGE